MSAAHGLGASRQATSHSERRPKTSNIEHASDLVWPRRDEDEVDLVA